VVRNQAEALRLNDTDFTWPRQPRPTKMKMLKRLFQFSRARMEIRGKPQPTPQAYSAIDNDEFARLLGSGRLEDLKILAQKLSGTPRVRI
jgi:hypothetical protein